MARIEDFEQRGRSGYYYRRYDPPRGRNWGSAYALRPCEGCGKPCLVQVGAPARKGRFCSAECAGSHRERAEVVGYRTAHSRLAEARGKATSCIWGCQSNRYEWANLTGNLLDPDDYAPMCRRCHIRFDAAIRMMTVSNRYWRPWRYAKKETT